MPTSVGEITRSLLIHGEVVRGDADFIRVDIPQGHRLASVGLVPYVSDDKISFFAIQRNGVFDAGTDVQRIIAYGQFGPEELGRNLVGSVAPESLGPGPLVLWINQTGPPGTRDAVQVDITPDR